MTGESPPCPVTLGILFREAHVNVNALRTLIATCPAAQPLTDAYEGRHPPTGHAWYAHQKEHLLGWLGEYHTAGAYDRQHPREDARSFYNRFQCVAGLLWLAEALGEDAATLKRAISEVDLAGRNPAAQCGAFRRIIPWTRVAELIVAAQSPALRSPDASLISALAEEVRHAPFGQLLLPSAALWTRLGVAELTTLQNVA